MHFSKPEPTFSFAQPAVVASAVHELLIAMRSLLSSSFLAGSIGAFVGAVSAAKAETEEARTRANNIVFIRISWLRRWHHLAYLKTTPLS